MGLTAGTRKHHLWEPLESLRPGAQGPIDHPRRWPKSGASHGLTPEDCGPKNPYETLCRINYDQVNLFIQTCYNKLLENFPSQEKTKKCHFLLWLY